MSNEWIYVTGKRSFKNQNRNDNSARSHRNPDHNLSQNPLTVDENIVNKNFEKITKQIHSVYSTEQKFLTGLVRSLKHTLKFENRHIYVLGCGTIENPSLVLSKSCIYQLGVCIIVAKVLNVKSTCIYDPVMTKNDYIVWNKLRNQEYEFRDLVNLAHSSDHDDCLGSDSKFDSLVHSTANRHAITTEAPLHTILWMPHCEKFLYKAVLEGIISNKSPLLVSRNTRKLSDDPSNTDFTTTDNDSPPEPANPDALHHDTADPLDSTHYEADAAHHFSIETTTLVGNSISDYICDGFNFLNPFNLKERRLLDFDTHPQSFNDTFVTTFESVD